MATPAGSGGGDLSIQMPAAAADPASDESQRRGSAAAKAEKRLNCFVRVLATMELVGNALGTLASLWASLVLIGGYRNSLEHVDFWIATVMIFMEAFRVFIRNFKFDNQSLFGSTKALRGIGSSFARMLWRPREGNEMLLIISWVMNFLKPLSPVFGHMAGLAVVTRMLVTEAAPRLMRQLRKKRRVVVVLITIPPTLAAITVSFAMNVRLFASDGFSDALIAAMELPDSTNIITQFIAVVLVNCRPRCITTLTSRPWGQRVLQVLKLISVLVLLLRVLLPLASAFFFFVFTKASALPRGIPLASAFSWSMEFATVVLLFCSLQDPAVANSRFDRCIDVIMNICFLWVLVLPSSILLPMLLIGNLQIPASVAQIGLSSWRLARLHSDAGPNMSMAVFYWLALCQGSLYIVACILALFSFFPRRWLVRRSDFRGKWGAKAVDLYYERAYTTRMEAGVFAENTISLASFAVDYLNSTTSSSVSSSREKQLAGVRVLHSLLQRKDSSQDIISVITRSEKAVPTLIGMFGWTFEEDRDIRLFAAMVTKELSGNLRIAGIPGAVKLVSSLLDAEKQSASVNNEGNASNQPRHEQEQSEQRGDNHGHGERWCSCLCRCWSFMKKKWSIPDEQPLTSSLPILGLEILEGLASENENCAKMIKVTNLVPKIIGLTSYSSNDESSIDNELKQQISSSLNLLRRLATRNGKIGVTLRQELWDSSFLVCNLAGILENSRSTEVLKPAMDIIAIMAWDEDARHELGSVQVIIHNLVHVFIVGQDGPTVPYDQSVRLAAGEALTNLAMESPVNCLAILEELRPRYKIVKDLEDMIGNNQYRCVAASLLQNLCACSEIRDKLRGPEARIQLSSDALLVVLEDIKTAKEKQLEALIGLASQIFYVLPPQCFVQGPEPPIIRETCLKLVDTLNSNKRPSHEYPRMRRAIIEMVISILGRYPHYAIIFRREGMMNALSKVEMSPSKVEKYRIFLGNEGVVLENDRPLRDLVARARGLIDSTNT